MIHLQAHCRPAVAPTLRTCLPGLLASLVAVAAAACGGEAARPDTVDLATSAIAESDGLAPVSPDLAVGPPDALAVFPAVFPAAPEPPSFAPVSLEETVEISVHTGENLVLLAGWAGIAVEELVAINGIDVRSTLQVGQILRIPAADDADLDFEIARQDFAEARLQRYLDARGGLVAVREHAVTTGESAWTIARDEAGVPTWVLAAYNGEAGLDTLHHGDILWVPVLGDTVAMLTDEIEVGLEGDDELGVLD